MLRFLQAVLVLFLAVGIVVLLASRAVEAAGCPPGSTVTAAGFCAPAGGGGDQGVSCTGPCDYCVALRGGPHPGEKVPPCYTCSYPTNVCLGCWQKLSCLQTVAPGAGSLYEPNFDRPGQDYTSFDVTSKVIDECESACNKDPKCKAWTYVKGGFQGVNARCWLKASVPALKSNVCCVSGLKAGICDYGNYWDANEKACLPNIH
jgi:hypothetical protein